MPFEAREHSPALYEAEFGNQAINGREQAIRKVFKRAGVDLMREGMQVPTDFTPGPQSVKAIKYAAKTRVMQELGTKIANAVNSDRIKVVDVEVSTPRRYKHGDEVIIFPFPERGSATAALTGQEEGILQMVSYFVPQIPEASLVGETVSRWDRNVARRHFPVRVEDYEDGTEIFRLETKVPGTFLELTYTAGERVPDFSLVFEPVPSMLQ